MKLIALKAAAQEDARIKLIQCNRSVFCTREKSCMPIAKSGVQRGKSGLKESQVCLWKFLCIKWKIQNTEGKNPVFQGYSGGNSFPSGKNPIQESIQVYSVKIPLQKKFF